MNFEVHGKIKIKTISINFMLNKKERVFGLSIQFLDNCRFFDLIFKVLNRNLSSKIGILLYHECKKERFARHLKFLKKKFQFISFNELYEQFKNNEEITKPSLVISFDDGSRSFYQNIFPIIKKEEIPVIHYITTGGIKNDGFYEFWFSRVDRLIEKGACIDKKHLKQIPFHDSLKIIEKKEREYNCESTTSDVMLNDQIKEIDKHDSITIGAHTVNHPCLTNISIQEARKEIVESKKHLENLLKHEIKHFAYPNGDFNEEIVEAVRKAGYKTAVIIGRRWIRINEPLNLFKIPRVFVGSNENSLSWVKYELVRTICIS